MMVALTQMSGFGGAGLGAGGVQSWNVPTCGPGDFVGGDECMCTLLQSAGKVHVEVKAASGPYINHHMSSSLNKMYSLLCFPWTPNGNNFFCASQKFNLTPPEQISFDTWFDSICLSCFVFLAFFLLLIKTHSSQARGHSFFHCPRCVNVQFKGRNVFSWCCLSVLRSHIRASRMLWNVTHLPHCHCFRAELSCHASSQNCSSIFLFFLAAW